MANKSKNSQNKMRSLVRDGEYFVGGCLFDNAFEFFNLPLVSNQYRAHGNR